MPTQFPFPLFSSYFLLFIYKAFVLYIFVVHYSQYKRYNTKGRAQDGVASRSPNSSFKIASNIHYLGMDYNVDTMVQV